MVAPMKKSLALTFCLLLAGCTEAQWNNALNYTGMGASGESTAEAGATPAAATPAAAPEAQADPNADLCRAVATQDATRSDFDQATQQRVFARSFSQCVAVFNR
jgi:hypothetical protein